MADWRNSNVHGSEADERGPPPPYQETQYHAELDGSRPVQELEGSAPNTYFELEGSGPSTSRSSVPTEPAYPRDVKAAGPAAQPPSRPYTVSPYAVPTPATSSSDPSTTPRTAVAIPQLQQGKEGPLLLAYAPILLHRGIFPVPFLAFLSTLTKLLTATTSDRAVAHGADVVSSMGDGPVAHYKQFRGHSREVAQGIRKGAKSGDVIGAVGAAIAGVVTVPISAAVGVTGAVLSVFPNAVTAASKKPLTARQRAEEYVASVNEDWLRERRVEAALVDSDGVAKVLGVRWPELWEAGTRGRVLTEEGLLGGLGGKAAKLEISEEKDAEETLAALEIGPASLWLVIRQFDG